MPPGSNESLNSVGLHEATEKQKHLSGARLNSHLQGTQLCQQTGHGGPVSAHSTMTRRDPSLLSGSPQFSSHGPKPIWRENL